MGKRLLIMNQPTNIRILLILLAILIGVVVGLVTGMLSKASGAKLPSAIRDAGIAFGGTVTLTILILKALGLL